MLKAPERGRYSEWPVAHSIIAFIGSALGYYYVTPPLFENPLIDAVCIGLVALGCTVGFMYAITRYSSQNISERFSHSESLNILAAGTLVWSILDVLSQWYYGYMETLVNPSLVAVYVLAAAFTFFAYYKAIKVATAGTRRSTTTAIATGMFWSIVVTLAVITGASVISEYAGIKMVSPECGIQTLADGTVVDTCDGTIQAPPLVETTQ